MRSAIYLFLAIALTTVLCQGKAVIQFDGQAEVEAAGTSADGVVRWNVWEINAESPRTPATLRVGGLACPVLPVIATE